MSENYYQRKRRIREEDRKTVLYWFQLFFCALFTGAYMESWWVIGGVALLLGLAYYFKYTCMTAAVLLVMYWGTFGWILGTTLEELGASVVLAAAFMFFSGFVNYYYIISVLKEFS